MDYASMKKLLYISPLPEKSQTGGANAVNYNTYKGLEKYFNCTYVQINPREGLIDRMVSKFFRKILKKRGSFYYFSSSRLKAIKNEFEAIEKSSFDLIFYKGFTPWILCKTDKPYYAYNDCNFQTFFENTFSYESFSSSQIEKIFAMEKEWMDKSSALFFESIWGKDICANQYQISRTKKHFGIGRGGNIPLPKSDSYRSGYNLLFIANIFEQKGGDLVFEALCQLLSQYPQLHFHIVGGKPGNKIIIQHPHVSYHGKLQKEDPSDLKKLISLMEGAFLLIHPTREDTNPLVITELGYFGCPAISVNRFAIPELIIHGETGILLSPQPTPKEIANSIKELIDNKEDYLKMRAKTQNHNLSQFTWDAIIGQLHQKINDHL